MDSRLLSGLEVLAAVVGARSFVRAGEALGLTQSGVSRAVARLEERVGVRLFERTARTVALTEEGRRFYERVAPLLTGIEDAANQAAGAAAEARGRLRVNVDPFFAQLMLAPKLGAFLTAHPDLQLELVVQDRLGDLVAEGFDAAVRFGEPEASALVGRRLFSTRILTCASPAYLKRHGRPSHPRELSEGHRCILFRDRSTGRPFPWEFHRHGKRPLEVAVSGNLIVNDVATALAVCESGWGIAQVMEIGIAERLKSRALVEIFPEWGDERFPLYVFHPSRLLPPAKVRAFLDFVIASTR